MKRKNSLLEKRVMAAQFITQKEHWLDIINSSAITSPLPKSEDNLARKAHEFQIFSFSANTSNQLIAISGNKDINLYTILVGLHLLFLKRCTGEGSITVGLAPIQFDAKTPVINPWLLLHSIFDNSLLFPQYLSRVKGLIEKAHKNRHYPLDILLYDLYGKEVEVDSFFHSAISLQSICVSLDENYSGSGLLWEFLRQDAMLHLKVYYPAETYTKAQIEDLFHHFEILAAQVLENKNTLLSDLEIISREERREILEVFKGIELPLPQNETFLDAFDRQVISHGNRIALVAGERKVTYTQLHVLANRVAAFLQGQQICRENAVAVCMTASIDMFAVILGIMKAGAAYLPIDPKLPADRINFMLEDAAVSVLFIAEKSDQYIVASQVEAGNIPITESLFARPKIQQNQLAYVIYTSGSTGKPKGVQVEHRALLNLCTWHNHYYNVTADDRTAKFAGVGFDASVWEIFPYLSAGASIHIPEESLKQDLVKLNNYLKEQHITITFLPTQLCEEFMQLENNILRAVLTGGDKLKRFRKQTYKLYNNYGPTENGVVTTATEITVLSDNLPIGKPIANNRVYILEKGSSRLQPKGMSGEICIAGSSLARGYLSRPELTAEKFVDDPFVSGAKMYRTGDLGRWLPDGQVEYLGRIDNQVQIRGFRVELGEIEAVVSRLSAIGDCVVTLYQHEQQTEPVLCAYVTLKEQISVEHIREALQKQLPVYMIPKHIIVLQRMPLTTNDKVDKKALPAPHLFQKTYNGPRNETEQLLASVLEEILQVKVNMSDDFFELGGDSIKAIKIQTQLIKQGYSIEIKQMFDRPKVEDIAKNITRKKVVFSQEKITGPYTLSPVQQWFFRRGFACQHHWNHDVLLELPSSVKPESLKEAITYLLSFHDVLRSRFKRNEHGKWEAEILAEAVFGWNIVAINEGGDLPHVLAAHASEAQTSLNLEAGRLVHATCYQGSENNFLHLIVHHLVVDGVSWRIILDDLSQVIAQITEGKSPVFAAKSMSYGDWVNELEAVAAAHTLEYQLDHWLQITSDIRSRKTLFTDTTSKLKNSEAFTLHYKVSKSKTAALTGTANKAFGTETTDLLLVAFYRTFAELFALQALPLTLEHNGRTPLSSKIQLNRTVGWFTAMYPVLLQTNATDLSDQVIEIKEQLRSLPEDPAGYGILAELQQEGALHYPQEFCFNYLGEFTEGDLGGLRVLDLEKGATVSSEAEMAFPISFNLAVVEGELSINMTVHPALISKEKAETLLQLYEKNLDSIIAHCHQVAVPVRTGSDYGMPGLSDAMLRKIKNTISELADQPEPEKVFPLGPMQKGLLFNALFAEGPDAYFEQISVNLHGTIDLPLLNKALEQLTERHEMLRALFLHEGHSEPVQCVLAQVKLNINYTDIQHREDAPAYIEAFLKEDRSRGFQLSKAPLMRITLLQKSTEEWLLVWSFHHILMDGWCIGLLFDELFRSYEALRNGQEWQPSQLPVSYSVYINWLRRQPLKAARHYWSNYLNEFEGQALLPASGLPTSFLREEVVVELGAEVSGMLGDLSRQKKVTQNVLLQAIWAVLLQKYTGKLDALYNTIVSGRPASLEGADQIIGLFINAIPVRVSCAASAQLDQVLQAIEQSLLEARHYEYVPIEDILADAGIPRNTVDHLFVYENHGSGEVLQKWFDGQRLGFSITENQAFTQTSYDLTVVVMPGDTLQIRFIYNADRVDATWINRLAGSYERMLQQLPEWEKGSLAEAPFITQEEKALILSSFNNTQKEYPATATIVEVFGQVVIQSGHKEALRYAQSSLTYLQLDRISNELTKVLVNSGVKKGDAVGVLCDRRPEYVIAILAVLKAGAAYLPLDPKLPAERCAYMLQDANAHYVLTLRDFAPLLPPSSSAIYLDGVAGSNGSAEAVNRRIDALQPAYLMYTSGSTGQPKGVLIPHRAVLRTVINIDYATLNSSTRVLLTGAVGFDATTFEIWGSLLNGGTLVIVDEETLLDAQALGEAIANENITTLWLTVSLFNQLVDQRADLFKGVKELLVGGDALSPYHINKVIGERPDLVVINGYGPTENTTFSTTYKITEKLNDIVPIGKPLNNSTAYVMDTHLNLLPVGVAGELCVGGDGLALGYLNNEKLTEERFVRHPYLPGERLYRTGDLARWMPDGNLEFLGRLDQQVKIRGYRIEPTEVALAIQSIEGVKQAIVKVCKTSAGEKFLAAYFTSDLLNETEVKESATKLLPAYMLPSSFSRMESLPINRNGKVDHNALPEPSLPASHNIRPAITEAQKEMEAIWADVLNVPNEKLGLDANFFEMGGHSIKAMAVINKVHERFGIRPAVSLLFNTPRLEDFTAAVHQEEKISYRALTAVPVQERYPLSAAQRRMFILQDLHPGSTAYNMPQLLPIVNYGKAAIEKAIQQLIERHESLRTSFFLDNEAPYQVVSEAVNFEMEVISVKDNQFEAVAQTLICPFDLAKAPLLRVALLESEQGNNSLFIDMHHIISDGASMQLLATELNTLLQAETLAPVRLQYRDYAWWEQSEEGKRLLQQQEAFWTGKFDGNESALALPVDFTRPKVQDMQGRHVGMMIGEERLERLRSFCRKHQITKNTFFMGCYYLLLNKLSQQEMVVAGMPVSGRALAGTEAIIGMFVNTLPLKAQLEPWIAVADLLQRLALQLQEALENQAYPLENLIEKLEIKKDSSLHPLFQVVFNYLQGEPALLPDIYHTAKFDLTLTVTEGSKDASVDIEYAASLFRHSTIERFARYYLQMMDQVISMPEQSIAQISLVGEEELKQLLSFNAAPVDYPRHKSLVELLEEQVRRTPDAKAVVFGESTLTYAELFEKASKLAATIQQKVPGTGRMIALQLVRGLDMPVAIWAVLMAGHAYLPFGTGVPAERMRFILEDAEVSCLLTDAPENLPHLGTTDIIDITQPDAYAAEGPTTVTVSTETLAYVIYTSGTTGQPKGVLISHYNVVSLVKNSNYITIQPEDKILQWSNYAFDGSVFDIFGAHLNGAALIMIDETAVADAEKLSSALIDQQVSVFFVTTALFNTLVDIVPESLAGVRNILFGGERVSIRHVRKALELLGPEVLLHVYGPTETTVFATYYPVREVADNDITVPIGYPLSNKYVFVLDAQLQPVPVGVAGELYIAGEGQSKGYLHRPELTAERFVQLPQFGHSSVYRTGDIVRFREDGAIEFLDRADSQVKIRGYRIELGEIEARLKDTEGIGRVTVVCKEDPQGVKFLCAYYEGKQYPVAALKQMLLQQLPDYMVPAYFMHMEAIPLNSNGKTDPRKLPEPELMVAEEIVMPVSTSEKMLQEIWAALLGISIERIGVNSDFFALGGDSLKLMRLINTVKQYTGIRVSTAALFHNPTLQTMSALINSSTELAPELLRAPQSNTYPVSAAQQRMFFMQQAQPESTLYNMPQVYKWSSTATAVLQDALNILLERHEPLRTRFLLDKVGIPEQLIEENAVWPLEEILLSEELREEQISSELASFVRPFDLGNELPVRARLYQTSKSTYLFLDIHHIVCDGGSISTLLSELCAVMEGKALLPLEYTFKDFAFCQQSERAKTTMQSLEHYWKDALQGAPEDIRLPYDNERPAAPDSRGGLLTVDLGKDLRDQFVERVQELGNTPYNTLLSLFTLLLHKLSGQEDLIIGVPVAGRNYKELEGMVGMFVNMLPLRSQLQGHLSFNEWLNHRKQALAAAIEHQQYPLEEMVNKLLRERPLNKHPFFEVVFNYSADLQDFDADMKQGKLPEIINLLPNTPLAKFDLTFSTVLSKDDLTLVMDYRKALFHEHTILQMKDQYLHLLEQFIASPEIQLSDFYLEDGLEAAYTDTSSMELDF
jgi:amino acid adenylation domain-containing protein/non-ribosomal peptide synthase protein (TIGR01720 family)